MSVKGEIKEGAGFIKEEMNEHGKSPESQRKAQEARDLQNEGRVEDGKTPKTTKPGTGHPEKLLSKEERRRPSLRPRDGHFWRDSSAEGCPLSPKFIGVNR
jgi:hypothetical protein